MPKRGNATKVPGVTRTTKGWTLRAVITGPDGKRRERQKQIDDGETRPTRRELADLVQKLRDELAAEAALSAEGEEIRLTLGAFAPRWIEHQVATGRARTHVVASAIRRLETFVLPLLGDHDIRKLRRADVSRWMAAVAKLRQPNGKLYGRTTLLGAWAVLRAMLRKAVVMLDLDHDPTHLLRLEVGDRSGSEERPSRGPKETVTLDELHRLLAAAKDESEDIAAMLVLTFSTGMRFCEVSALEWRDIDLDAGKLRIERSQVGGAVGSPKTEGTRRDVYLGPAVVDVLRGHLKWQEENVVAVLIPGLVFPTTKGGYRTPGVLMKPLRRCCARAGIQKHLSSHCLRKTANNLIRQASGDTVARSMLGHATTEMTRLYSNVDSAERAKAHHAAFGDVFAESAAKVGRNGGTTPRPTQNQGDPEGGERENP